MLFSEFSQIIGLCIYSQDIDRSVWMLSVTICIAIMLMIMAHKLTDWGTTCMNRITMINENSDISKKKKIRRNENAPGVSASPHRQCGGEGSSLS